jgi:hypothetical protein
LCPVVLLLKADSSLLLHSRSFAFIRVFFFKKKQMNANIAAGSALAEQIEQDDNATFCCARSFCCLRRAPAYYHIRVHLRSFAFSFFKKIKRPATGNQWTLYSEKNNDKKMLHRTHRPAP